MSFTTRESGEPVRSKACRLEDGRHVVVPGFHEGLDETMALMQDPSGAYVGRATLTIIATDGGREPVAPGSFCWPRLRGRPRTALRATLRRIVRRPDAREVCRTRGVGLLIDDVRTAPGCGASTWVDLVAAAAALAHRQTPAISIVYVDAHGPFHDRPNGERPDPGEVPGLVQRAIRPGFLWPGFAPVVPTPVERGHPGRGR